MEAIRHIEKKCRNCNLCVRECAFLQENGTPGSISLRFMTGDVERDRIYQCNLCQLCRSVCPRDLDCVAAYVEMRRILRTGPEKNPQQHNRICAYERRGRSPLFSLNIFPEKCTSIFFPGCTLAGTRAAVTESTYQYLRTLIPHLGIVLNCCAKPSHDLGRDDVFKRSFTELTDTFQEHNITTIITACPSCYTIFKEYAPDLETVSTYEILAANPPATRTGVEPATVVIHDACATRFFPEIHDAVRKLVVDSGAKIAKMKHSRNKTLCCGEGGAAAFVAPELTGIWKDKRKTEADGKDLITYCAGCSSRFGRKIPNTHLLDLLFSSKGAGQGTDKVAVAPFTYMHRIRLKKRLIMADRKERAGREPEKRPGWNFGLFNARFCLLAFILMIAVGLRIAGFDNYLYPENSEKLLRLCMDFPPLLYIVIMALAPVLFLPGFPFVIAGGILYGRIWGLVYAVTGATIGSGLAFLISRYIGSHWVRSLLSNSKWSQIDAMTRSHGWKIVIFLRLIPLFPFTPLNYVLGLTNIRFSHYVIATFLGILPACLAFVFFSGSVFDLLRGNITFNVLIGLSLVLLVMSTPFIYKKYLMPENGDIS